MEKQPVLERFFDKVEKDESTGCWNFNSCVGVNNQGRFTYKGKCWDAYKIGYVLMVGEVPDKMHLHHKCENRRCVNPNHLEILTPKEHKAKHSFWKTHCPKGHEYTSDNLVPVQLKKGKKVCIICARERSKNCQQRKRRLNPSKYNRSSVDRSQAYEIINSKDTATELAKKFGMSYSRIYSMRREGNSILNIYPEKLNN